MKRENFSFCASRTHHPRKKRRRATTHRQAGLAPDRHHTRTGHEWCFVLRAKFAKMVHFFSRFSEKVQKAVALQCCTPSLHRGCKHTGFRGAGNGESENIVKSRTSLRRGSLHPGLTVVPILDNNVARQCPASHPQPMPLQMMI